MSVRPVAFHDDGSVDVIFDEQGHVGTIAAAQIAWVRAWDDSENHDHIVLVCPDGCGAVSTHPVGGGAAPLEVQTMFVRKVERDGCACGVVEPGLSNAVPQAHVHLQCSRMDGPQRWQGEVAPVTQLAGGEQSSRMFQVVYRRSDGLIVGESPRGGVGPDNGVAVIHDMAEYEILMRTDPAYLSVDGDHIMSTPRE